jgi:hypothetical protein
MDRFPSFAGAAKSSRASFRGDASKQARASEARLDRRRLIATFTFQSEDRR